MALYAKIQTLVQNEARKIATDTYNDLGTKYNVAQVPAHSHNGIDSNRLAYKDIIQGNKYTTVISEDTTETATIGGIYNPTRILFQGFAANNAVINYELDGPLSGGETSANLLVTWTGNTGGRSVTFSNGDVRYVTFTNGSVAITWVDPLSGPATVDLIVGANLRAIINGEINFGTCFEFTDLTPPITVLTSGAGQPFLQSTNSMYVDSNDLTKNRVAASAGAGSDATAFFIISRDETGTVFASARATSYNNQTGILTIDFVVGNNVRIQGAFTIT